MSPSIPLARTRRQRLVAAVASSRASIDPQWLKDLVPGFADPEVGLIQAPQDHRDGCRRSSLPIAELPGCPPPTEIEGLGQYLDEPRWIPRKDRGETPVFGRSSNGGFCSGKVENALSFNGD
jgi:hypothetical protein